jgi:predicted HTH transcriptional regulator
MKRRELIADGINQLMNDLITEKPKTNPKTVDYYRKVGENEKIEFKSSLRWDLYQKQPNKKLEDVIAKTISGFMNTDGGVLLIGVADDGSILGIENDINSLSRKDLDGFQQRLIQIVDNYIGTMFTKYIHINFENKNEKTVCIIKVERSPRKPAYFNDKDNEEFYIRAGNTTRPLKRQETVDYVKDHFIN